MRDPFTWSFPIGTLFGITVRVSFLVPLLMFGFVFRAHWYAPSTWLWLDALQIVLLAFLSIVLHELGHSFAARWVGGDSNEILLWPLGGLARCEIPHHPRAHFIVAAAGPAVNAGLCFLCAILLATVTDPPLRPNFNPIDYPPVRDALGLVTLATWSGDLVPSQHLAVLLAAQLFYVNYLFFLLNVLLVGIPLDGGRMMQAILWPLLDYRRATLYAIFSGFGIMILLLLLAFAFNEVMLPVLAWYIYNSCKQEWLMLEGGGEDSPYGDFSAGYTSLERDEPKAPPRRKKLNFIQRWLQQRAARRMQAEIERQEAEDRRMDELLEKIQLSGKQSLTDEEQRFLKRVSDRYRNKS